MDSFWKLNQILALCIIPNLFLLLGVDKKGCALSIPGSFQIAEDK